MAPKRQADQLTDEDVLTGHPASGVDPAAQELGEEAETHEETSQQPVTRKVKISGREVEVDETVAAALEEREREFNRKLSEQAAEVGYLRNQVRGNTPQSSTQTKGESDPLDDPELENLWFRDPKEAAKRLIKKTTTVVLAEAQKAYSQAEGQRQFWTDFDSDYPELKRCRTLANAILQQKLPQWQHLSMEDARQNLAASVKDELSKYGVKPEVPSTSSGTKRTVVEGSSAPKSKAEHKGPEPKTLGDLLKERRESRRKAASKRPATAA